MPEKTPENRVHTACVGITPSEKRAIDLVAMVEEKAISDLLRPAVDQLVARGNEYMSRLQQTAAA